MRYKFSEILFDLMSKDENVFFMTGDLGFKIFDRIISTFPDRAMNVGAAEQLMVGMAVGLADSGKIPFIYSITPFALYRPFEVLRTYVNHENTNIKIVGSGRDDDYSHDGFTHYAGDDKEILKCLKGIECHWPNDKDELESVMRRSVVERKPFYINLKR